MIVVPLRIVCIFAAVLPLTVLSLRALRVSARDELVAGIFLTAAYALLASGLAAAIP
ncbi:MAG: hypothetical protein QN173_11035 [Armatimonadota bacterium]|nr:hypothetical protein [Armatimonadota bacterium]MDR7401554.1 hypothetical protein [Armatimonadota bacterium]MDR7403296.1 hypothetical protein [Armatimonadota bacterium]MDR7438209.1 hypothetical protein [Armatimonadota bacterium]MDR7471638.1 hypothetical protein [Armatimonadota bacterium]